MILKPPTQDFRGDPLAEELRDAGAESPTVFARLNETTQEYSLDIQAAPLTEDQIRVVVAAHTGDPTEAEKQELAKAKRLGELKTKTSFSKAETDELLKLLLERL